MFDLLYTQSIHNFIVFVAHLLRLLITIHRPGIRPGQTGSGMTDHHSPASGSWSPEVVLLAAVDILTWIYQRKVAFIASLLHIEVSTIDLLGLSAKGLSNPCLLQFISRGCNYSEVSSSEDSGEVSNDGERLENKIEHVSHRSGGKRSAAMTEVYEFHPESKFQSRPDMV